IFFPELAPRSSELQLIHLIHYQVIALDGHAFTIQAMNTQINSMVIPPFQVPSYYLEHVKHFLWWHHLFMGINEHASHLVLAKGMCPLIQQYIMYMDGIIEGLFTSAQNQQREGWWSALFDLYLVVEYLVKRYEYNIGDKWRKQNPDHILECLDVTSLDWKKFYLATSQESSTWTGLQYEFNITNVPDNDWQDLADAAATYLNFTNPNFKCK
ncbi:hypothetical protein PAXRUDRAFT_179457, partial [Paxillus rubicundulus Ve08.2h10]